jgi:hypothetical protein
MTKRKGFIKGQLNKRRSVDTLSIPGADLEFIERTAVSNSQSEITGGISPIAGWIADQATASTAEWVEPDGGSSGKNCGASSSSNVAGSDERVPLKRISEESGIDLDIPLKSDRGRKTSPSLALSLNFFQAAHFADLSAR